MTEPKFIKFENSEWEKYYSESNEDEEDDLE